MSLEPNRIDHPMADVPRDPAGNGDPLLPAEVVAYVRTHLTAEELRRTARVIDEIGANASTQPTADKPVWAGVLAHWRRFVWATSGLSVALLALVFFGMPSGRVRLHILSSETRNATLPPELELDLKSRSIRVSGSGVSLQGPFDLSSTAPLASMPIVLKSSDGSADFRGTLQLTNSTDGKSRIVGAYLEGTLRILDVGTNEVSASFSN